MFRPLLAAGLLAALCFSPSPARAQVLIWSIPEQDSTSVRFEGTYKQVLERPLDKRGSLAMEWDAGLVIKSVGEETAEFEGKQTKCRWIEFVSTIKPRGIKPGPSGTRIYKVLVPIERVTGKLLDADGLPNDFVPIVKGFRKFGDGPVEEVKEKALSVNPLIVPVVYYPDLKPESTEPAPVELTQIGEVPAVMHQGQSQFVSETFRTTNKAKLWLSKNIPFGLAKLEVTVVHEQKDSLAPDDQFRQTSQVDVVLGAVEIKESKADEKANVESDLPDSK